MMKQDIYRSLLVELEAFLGPNGYSLSDIGKMATISSCLYRSFPEWIFAGFYRVVAPELLEIGPCQGPVIACGTIRFGHGVCGKSAARGETIIVPDVREYPGYIACDDKTISEIVIPIKKAKTVLAVLDIDSPEKGYFDSTDQHFLERIVQLI
ncbi:MAG: GAF domain-containing protein [Fidelibacterota bacterium]